MDSCEGCRQWVGDLVLLLKYEKARQWAESDLYASIPYVLFAGSMKVVSSALRGVVETAKDWFPAVFTRQRVKID